MLQKNYIRGFLLNISIIIIYLIYKRLNAKKNNKIVNVFLALPKEYKTKVYDIQHLKKINAMPIMNNLSNLLLCFTCYRF